MDPEAFNGQIFKSKDFKVNSVTEGIKLIKARLGLKKVPLFLISFCDIGVTFASKIGN